LHLISKEIVKRYIASASRNVGTSREMQKLCDGLRNFSVGLLQLLISRSFLQPLLEEDVYGTTLLVYIVIARRGAEEHLSRGTQRHICAMTT